MNIYAYEPSILSHALWGFLSASWKKNSSEKNVKRKPWTELYRAQSNDLAIIWSQENR